ncbi:MAG: Xaa-Pro peptidase family protein [Butyrivibrio sp.]|nr:Xaa-Pro peptidase family protein [Butyrivibrio sp.]
MDNFLKEKNLDAIIVSDPYNMRHISGFRGGEGYVYVSGSRKVIITDSRYTEAADNEKKEGFEVIDSRRSDMEILKELAASDKAARIGFEDLFVTCADYGSLKEKCGFENMVPLGDSLNRRRSVKTAEELEYLRKAEAIGDKAFESVLGYLKPGLTELEVAAYLEYSMKMNGASGLGFETIAASGPNTSMPHAVPGGRKLEKGDFVTMDFGCNYEGYCSDMTRTVVIGKASDKQKEIYGVVLEAQLAAIDAIRAGVKGCDIHNIAADIIAKAGYGEYFGHGLGHSVGLYIHEVPMFSPREKEAIPEGAVLTVEPGIYVPGLGGVRIEDMGAVTKDGYDNFTHSPKELIEIF